MRFDSSSRGILAQHLMSLLNVVTLINKDPDGAIQHREFGEASETGYGRDQRKIAIELNPVSLTVHASPTTIRAICGWRLLLNGDAPEGVAQVGGEIGERARSDGEEDDSALWIDRLRDQCEGKMQRRTNGCVVPVRDGGQRDRPLVFDNSQLESAVGGGRRAQCGGQRRERVVQMLIILANAGCEILKMREQGSWEIHTRAPRKRIRPLVVTA
jgi:hypothetical protein